MTFSVKIIADSVSDWGGRLTTFQLRYPRMIHAELLTHRMFSRNASSSRAVPVAKMIEEVTDDPVEPIHWGKNQPGMQAQEELSGMELILMRSAWRSACEQAVTHASMMASVGAHKQIINRILEPYAHISVVLTSTQEGLANFFWLRCHEDAQPEMQRLAEMMRDAYHTSCPRLLVGDQWHLPYVSDEEFAALGIMTALKVSAARCCRVSYLKHDGQVASIEEDLALCDHLIGSVPLHASPFEHQATPDYYTDLQGNLPGWLQYRKMLDGEFQSDMGCMK
jgi:hypothetical protein